MLKYRELFKTLEILKSFKIFCGTFDFVLFLWASLFFPKKIRIECHFKCIGLCKQAHLSPFYFCFIYFHLKFEYLFSNYEICNVTFSVFLNKRRRRLSDFFVECLD